MPDQLYFIGVGYTPYDPHRPPPLGDGQYVAADCYGVEFSVASQEIADLLAQINPTICQGQPPSGGGRVKGGGVPSAPVDQRVPFYNSPQSASGGCSSQSVFTKVVPAASFVIMAFPDQGVGAQAAVNERAQAYAQQQVVEFDFCVGCTNDVGAIKLCVDQVYGSTNLFVMKGAAGNVTWSSSGLPPGIHLTPGTTTAVTDAGGDAWVRVGGNTWMNLTSGARRQGQPQGTSASNTGTADLFGTATQAGNFSFTVTALAANGNSSTFKGTISVLGFNNPATLPNGSICLLYNQTLEAAGGTGPYTFRDGELPSPIPNGLTMPNGILHGDLAPGTYHFTIVVRDSLGQECSKLFSLTFDPSATQPSFTTPTALPNGHANSSYFTPIVVTGGCPSSVDPPYVLTLDSGTMPYNFRLIYSGGWEIVGYPGVGDAGNYSFSIKATDWAGQSVTKAFTLTIDTDVVVTGSCVGGGPSSSGSSPQIAPPGGSRPTAGAELTQAAAINDLITNLNALGCTCPPIQVTVDPSGPHTTFHNTSATCSITVHTPGHAEDFLLTPGATSDFGQQYKNNNGNFPSGLWHFQIGGGVTFDSTY